MQGVGAQLRERRDAMGVTLAEVEVATRIRQKYLSALEADEWHLLPGEVVGRGFLRNYADYLGLEPQEIIERRRAVTDPGLSVALSTTSAGAPLPAERTVDYRPKEVELKDDGDGIQRGDIRLTPILAILGVALVVALGWWGISIAGDSLGSMMGGVQTSSAGLFERPEVTPTAPMADVPIAGVVNEENLGASDVAAASEPAPGGVVILGSGGETPTANPEGAGADANAPVILLPTPTEIAVVVEPTPTPAVPTPEPPTPEPPTPEPPTATPEPPTPTPEPPTPEPPAVVAAACADARAVISSPGVGQVLSGMVGVTGSASHEAFQYFKLEYAPGANAGGGFVYFDGANVAIAGGLLGNFNTGALPNGDYTIRLTVVDQSGNFPPPCDVSVVISN